MKQYKHIHNYRNKHAKFRQFQKLHTQSQYKPRPARVYTRPQSNKHHAGERVKGEHNSFAPDSARPRPARVSTRPEANKYDTNDHVKGEHDSADSDSVKHDAVEQDSGKQWEKALVVKLPLFSVTG